MTASARLLDRLSRVRRTRPGSYSAACPCCESRKGRPLAITEKDDGRVLLHAFCGCLTEDVLGRIGLEITDLFDKPLAHAPASTTRVVSARDVLAALTPELTFLALIANDIQQRRAITDKDWDRLATATQRITAARDYVG